MTEGRDILQGGALQARRDVLLDTCREVLAAGDDATLGLVLNAQHAADLAEALRRLEEEEARRCLGLLAEGLAARVMAELDPSTVVDVAGELDERVLSEIVEEMAPDDAADVLADLPDDRSDIELGFDGVDEYPTTFWGQLVAPFVAIAQRLGSRGVSTS